MPVSDDQWRASVGAINAGRSRALARLSSPASSLPVKGSAWKEDVLGLLWCLLVMAACGGIWLVLEGRAVVGKAAGLVRRKDPKEWLFLVVVAVVYHEQLMSLSRQASPPIRPGYYSLHERPGSGCGGYLSVVFYLAVLHTLLLLSGDVETNPGPLFSLTLSNLNQLCELLAEVRDWNHLRIRLGIHEYCNNLKTTLEWWLISNPNPTWTKLASALREMRHVTLADRILSTPDLRRQESVMSQDALLPNSSSAHSFAAASSVSLPPQTKSWDQAQATGMESSQITSQATPTPISYVSNTEQEVYARGSLGALGEQSRNLVALPLRQVSAGTSVIGQQQLMAIPSQLQFVSQQVMQNTEAVVWRGSMQITDWGYMYDPSLRCQVSSDKQIKRELQLHNWLPIISMDSWMHYGCVSYLISKPWREVKRVTFQFPLVHLQIYTIFRRIIGMDGDFSPQIGGVVRVADHGPVTHLVLVWDKWANKFLGLVPHDQSIIYENQLTLSRQQQASLGNSMLPPPPFQQKPYLQPQLQSQQQPGVGGDTDLNWCSPNARKSIIQSLEKSMEGLSNLQNPIEVEKAFFEKSRNKEEYMNYCRNFVLSSRRARQGDIPRMNQAAMMGAGLGQSVTGDGGSADLPFHDNSNDDNVIDHESQENAKKLFFEAMEKGYVTSQSIVIILIGIAGSGKSSFKRVVLNQPPEEKRISTALTDATIRNISISRAIVEGSESVDWEVVTPEELLTMVADAIKKVVPHDDVTKTHAEPSKDVTAVIKPSKDNGESSTVNIGSKTCKTHVEPSKDGTSLNIFSKTDMDTVEPCKKMMPLDISRENVSAEKDLSEDIELDDSIVQLISKSQGSQKSLLDVHWVYVIDTGGQPQFLQLLPAFIKNISSCVCFVRLDQSLDDKPPILFFDKEGKQCGDSYPSERTNLQVIESCVRTIHSRCCLNSDASPNILIVGTHQDEYERIGHPETIEMKNERLINHLSALLEENLTFFEVGNNSSDTDRLIFPLNCKKPGKQDRSVAAEFRKCVMTHCREPRCKIPLAWFVLEQYIRQHAIKSDAAYIKKSTCWLIAEKLNMSKETFEAALNHLLKLSIFRCYSSLPDLIFCDTQVVLLKLTELVQYSFQLQKAIVRGVSGEERSFKNEGIVSLAFLSRFPKFYSSTFTPECFLKILRELLAIADLKKEKYFLPCLLPELSEKDASKFHRSSDLLSTLLLRLDGGCIPNGLFTSLISSLKNDHHWKLNYKNRKPACLFQNCVMFELPGQLPGSVTLIASFEYIEIHVICIIESELDGVCTKIYENIKSGLEASWKVLYPGSVSFHPAFFCSSCTESTASASTSSADYESSKNHYANISACGNVETCSLDRSHGTKLSESKSRWLTNICYYSSCTSVEAAPLSEDHSVYSPSVISEETHIAHVIQAYLSGVVPDTHLPLLENLLDWDNEGVDKDLNDIADTMVDWEVKLTSHFNLTPANIHDIKAMNQTSPPLQRRAVMRKWKNDFGLSATYRKLLEIFVSAKCHDSAKAVCEVLRRKGSITTRRPGPNIDTSLPTSKRVKN